MEASKALWIISDELEAVGVRIAEVGGELSPELEAELDAIEGDFSAKVERVALYIRSREIDAEGAKAEKDRLAAIQKANEASVRGLKQYLLGILERHGRDKVDTMKARVRRSPSPWSYRWTGDTYEAIPDEYRKQNPVVYSLNVERVKRAIEDGTPLPDGVVVERGFHIRIT